MVRKYKKLPIVVNAIQWDGENHKDVCRFVGTQISGNEKELIVHTLEGDLKASVGAYIIKGINGEFYPCKPDIFEQTYEEATC